MAVIPVTSNYNVRRRKQSLSATVVQPLDESPRLLKRSKTDVFTPPASPEVMDTASCDKEGYEDDHDDAVLMGIFDYMRRSGGSAMCSREISEGILSEGKVPLVGATPSTLVDSSIKQHHKRCSSSNRPNIIQKIADPSFPRKTLYHLADADPFAPRRTLPKAEAPKVVKAVTMRKKEDVRLPQQQQTRVEQDTSESDEESIFELDTHIDDCQGPFAASLDLRRRMSLSPSDGLDFSISIDDDAFSPPAVPTPVSSLPVSPSKEVLQKSFKFPPLNIALPPSPFIAPRDRVEEDADHEATLKLPNFSNAFTNSPMTRGRDYASEDFLDVDVQSPEAVSLDDLDYLLGF